MAITPWPRTTKVTAVAQASAASTKNCHGWSESSAGWGETALSSAGSVEIAELIVEALFH